MPSIAFIFLALAMLTTLGILFTGIVGMMIGGEFNEKYGNKLMRARVICQLVAVFFFALFMLTSQG